MQNILHISDLHISTGAKGLHYSKVDSILQKLISDINSISDSDNIAIDTIFFTGDISNSGLTEEYTKFRECFLSPLLDQLKLSIDSVYMVPGNHDSDRESISRSEKKYRSTSSQSEIEEMASDILSGKEEWIRQSKYFEFYNDLFPKRENEVFSNKLGALYKINKKFHIALVNTSWLAQNDEDKNKLSITKSQWNQFNKKVPKNSELVVLMHHPFEWLSNEDAALFSEFIEKRVNIVFYGHMHEFKQSLEVCFKDDITLRLQAGTLDTRHENSGYSIVSLQKKDNVKYGTILYRSYNSDEENFVSWTERGNEGRFDFATNGDITFDTNKFASYSRILAGRVDDNLLVNVGVNSINKKKVSDLFIEPNFDNSESSLPGKLGSNISNYQELANHPKLAILLAGENQGKSFLLNNIYVEALARQSQKDFSEIVFKLDSNIDNLSSGSKVIKSLCDQYIDNDLTTSFERKVKLSIEEGSALILIDDFCKLDDVAKQALVEFMGKYSNCRFIITCSKVVHLELLSLFEKNNISDLGVAKLGGLKRENIRQIISKWNGQSTARSQNSIYADVMKVVRHSQLPHNHFVYSTLLAIYENKGSISQIYNEAHIIEVFIEMLLKKHNMVAKPNEPQYQDLLNFLGFLAQQMVNYRQGDLTEIQAMDALSQFNEKSYNSFSRKCILSPLIESGILKKLNSKNDIMFSQKSFLDYAISHQMRYDKSLKLLVLKEDNYLHFNKAIEYYACKESEFDILKMVSDRTFLSRNNVSAAIKLDQNIDIECTSFDELNQMSLLDMASSSVDFEDKVKGIKADRQNIDRRLDAVSPLCSSGKKADLNEFNLTPALNNKSISKLVDELHQNMSLFSRVFRNSESIYDHEKIMESFKDIIDCYLFLVKVNIVRLDDNLILPILLPIFENKIKDKVLSEKEKDKFLIGLKHILSLVRGIVPNHIQSLMTDDLGSKKARIGNIIEKFIKDNSNEMSSALLTYILIDLEFESIKILLKRFEDVKDKTVLNTLFFKIMQLKSNDHSLTPDEHEFIEHSLKKLIKKNRELSASASSMAFSFMNL